MDLQETGTQDSNQDLNDLLASIGESPMPEEAATAEPAEPAQPEAPTWNGEEWKFTANGKDIVPQSRDDILGWMSRGYNYSQRMGELNQTHAQRMAEIEAKARAAAELEQRYSPFAKVNEYAEKNPDWWAFVTQSYEQKQAQEKGIDPQFLQALTPIQQELQALRAEREQRLAAEEQARVLEQQQTEDNALDADIQSTRKLPEFANIDWNAKNERGEPLELQVLNHGIQNGIPSFKAAARDYLFPQLVTQQKAAASQQQVKERQAQAKAGISRAATPAKGELKRAPGRLGWNHQDLSVEAAMAEYAQTQAGG